MNLAHSLKKCNICNKDIQLANYNKHYKACEKNSKKVNICKICYKEFPFTGRTKSLCGSKDCLSKNIQNRLNNPETRTKMSNAKKDKKQTQEQIDKRMNTMKKNAEKRGYWHSEETKEKIGKAHLGISESEESKRNISLAIKGKKLTEEHKQKISKGLNFSENFQNSVKERTGKTYEQLYGEEKAQLKKDKYKNTMLKKYGVECAFTLHLIDFKNNFFKTKIEKELSNILDEINLKHKQQFCLFTEDNKRKFYDQILLDYNLIIEADGEYWHSLPECIENDKIKTELAKKNNFDLIRFTGNELINNKEYVKNTILDSINILSLNL